MKEQLYTIPVNEAFDCDCECPVCLMKHKLKEDIIDFTLGPSYMEDDVRMKTDEVGFCKEHVVELYNKQNRLGLALMMKTHADYSIKEVERLSKGFQPGKTRLFGKKEGTQPPLLSYLSKLQSDCYVCERMQSLFERYIVTIFYLYSKEEEFRKKIKTGKGFCNEHYALLLSEAGNQLEKKLAEEFVGAVNEVYLSGMKRVRDELSWFIDKFDYRNADAPWKNSKDALQRMMTKQNGIKDNTATENTKK